MNDELHLEGTSVTWKGREVAGRAPRAAAVAAGLLVTTVLVVAFGLLLPVLVEAAARGHESSPDGDRTQTRRALRGHKSSSDGRLGA
jgi:hypothetical protein